MAKYFQKEIRGGFANGVTLCGENGNLYAVCGSLGGAKGGGSMWEIDPNSGSEVEVNIDKGGMGNCQAMCSQNGMVYAVFGQMTGLKGGGGIYEYDLKGSTFRNVSKSGWKNGQCIAAMGGYVYVICGRLGNCTGSGSIWEIDIKSGGHREVNVDKGGWKNAQCMTAHNGKLYIICGKMYGCSGGGGLYEVDLKTSFHRKLSSGWENGQLMTAMKDGLYVICGRMGGLKGGGSIYNIDYDKGTHTLQQWEPNGWKNAQAMCAMDGVLYVICGRAHGLGGGGGVYALYKESTDEEKYASDIKPSAVAISTRSKKRAEEETKQNILETEQYQKQAEIWMDETTELWKKNQEQLGKLKVREGWFLSYKQQDGSTTLIERLYNNLKGDNWYDMMYKKDRTRSAMIKGIARRDKFICFVSPKYFTSEWCCMELTMAMKLKKIIVPVYNQDQRTAGVTLGIVPQCFKSLKTNDFVGLFMDMGPCTGQIAKIEACVKTGASDEFADSEEE